MYLIHELDSKIYVAVVANVAEKFEYQAIIEIKTHWRLKWEDGKNVTILA
jgi:hypothetical protein